MIDPTYPITNTYANGSSNVNGAYLTITTNTTTSPSNTFPYWGSYLPPDSSTTTTTSSGDTTTTITTYYIYFYSGDAIYETTYSTTTTTTSSVDASNALIVSAGCGNYTEDNSGNYLSLTFNESPYIFYYGAHGGAGASNVNGAAYTASNGYGMNSVESTYKFTSAGSGGLAGANGDDGTYDYAVGDGGSPGVSGTCGGGGGGGGCGGDGYCGNAASYNGGGIGGNGGYGGPGSGGGGGGGSGQNGDCLTYPEDGGGVYGPGGGGYLVFTTTPTTIASMAINAGSLNVTFLRKNNSVIRSFTAIEGELNPQLIINGSYIEHSVQVILSSMKRFKYVKNIFDDILYKLSAFFSSIWLEQLIVLNIEALNNQFNSKLISLDEFNSQVKIVTKKLADDDYPPVYLNILKQTTESIARNKYLVTPTKKKNETKM
jgi:hypothetical protein